MPCSPPSIFQCRRHAWFSLALLLLPRRAVGARDLTLESFEPPSHDWTSVNDPVMGGRSSGSFAVGDDGVGVFEGEVRDVPSLSAPGFAAVRTPERAGRFPDASSCDGLRLRVRSATDYGGFRLSFGTNFAGSMPYAHGYKARFDVPVLGADGGDGGDGFVDVELKFTDFSDNWDPKTGDVVVSCADDGRYCPDDATLKDMKRMEVMAEGVDGKVRLEIDSIVATNCDDDAAEEAAPAPGKTKRDDGTGKSMAESMAFAGSSGGNTKSIVVEDFSSPNNQWSTLNDPVMGGQSYSNVELDAAAGVARFSGKCAIVPSLRAPGFITMQAGGTFAGAPGRFPDVSTCAGLEFELRTNAGYDGYRVSFGKAHPKGGRFAYGYKAPLPMDDLPPVGEFGTVEVPFNKFSDKWNDATGDIQVECADDQQYCPSQQWLRSMETISFWGEGVEGTVDLEVRSIRAVGCDGNASEEAVAPSAITSRVHTVRSNPVFVFYFFALAVVGVVASGCVVYGCRRGKGAPTGHQPLSGSPDTGLAVFKGVPVPSDGDFHDKEEAKDLEIC